MKYNVGDVIGTVTLVVEDTCNGDEVAVGFKELDSEELNEIIDTYLDVSIVDNLAVKLDPSKRKEMLLKQREEIDKQLEELGNE